MLNTEYVHIDWQSRNERYMRDGFGDALVVNSKDNVVVLTADLGSSLRLDKFKNKFPDRLFNVGVSEQNMIGVAAGLSKEGFVSITTSFGVFSPGRTWDQIRVSVCYSDANVKIIGSHGGLATGEDGATHQALEDIAIMRVFPNVIVVAPCDYSQAMMATKAIIDYKGPVYMRLVRPKSFDFTKEVPFQIGKSYVYRYGKDVTVLSYGLQVFDVLMVAEELSDNGVDVEVIKSETSTVTCSVVDVVTVLLSPE